MTNARRTLPLLLTLVTIGGILAWGLAIHPGRAGATAPVECPTITIVDRDEPVTCDLDGSQLLIVTGIAAPECAHNGGIYRPDARACLDVDY